jgi:hypothetical protein
MLWAALQPSSSRAFLPYRSLIEFTHWWNMSFDQYNQLKTLQAKVNLFSMDMNLSFSGALKVIFEIWNLTGDWVLR